MRKHLLIIAGLIGAFVAFSGTAKADNSFSLHLEPGLVQPLTVPQSNIYSTGGVLTVKPMFTLLPYLTIGPSVSAMYLPRQTDNGQNAGVVWQFDGSLRLQGDRRSNAKFWKSINPWIDMDLGVGQTGDLTRPVWDIGVGAEVPLDQNHIAWFGPFLRYTHLFNTSDVDNGKLLDPRDVNFLQVGVSVSFDTPTHRRVERVETERLVVKREVVTSPPVRTVKLVLQPEKLDLTEKVYFDFDKSTLRWESNDKLDAVVAQLNAHPNLKIKVEGHASSDGNKQHNIKLSGERTSAVVAYLVRHGVSASRLEGVALGIDQPAAPNTTQEGRERNRRVEFTVSFISFDSK
jgi:outer membrane protein OmpA-like peptidoglycan-associated protein